MEIYITAWTKKIWFQAARHRRAKVFLRVKVKLVTRLSLKRMRKRKIKMKILIKMMKNSGINTKKIWMNNRKTISM